MARFQPGQSGNPHGRPRKGKTLTELLAAKMDKQKFVEALLQLAYGGDVAAIKLVLNYVEGMPVQKVENAGQQRLLIEYINDWRNPQDYSSDAASGPEDGEGAE